MAKNILVLNSSPRAKGNTDALSSALIAGACRAGHATRQINIRSLHINPCIGCYQCVRKKGDPCVQKDDMKEIYDAISLADVVVFASPLYCWQFNAQMKMVIDRTFALAAANDMRMPSKEVALLVAAEDAREENFAQILSYYRTCFIQNLHWTDKGMVLAGGVDIPGEVAKTPYMKEAEALGASL